MPARDFTTEATFETKAADDGLIIEGYASDWGEDREGELFESGAFKEGLKSFLDSNPVLLYHHQYDKALGRVLEAKADSKGLWVKAQVDQPAPGSWAEDIFQKIKTRTIRGFSVGGRFHRRGGGGARPGARIEKVDFRELSVTPMPVNPRTMFQLGTKAMEEMEDEDLGPLEDRVAAAESIFDRIARLVSQRSVVS